MDSSSQRPVRTARRASETASGRPLWRLDGHTRWVQSAAFSSDGKRLVTASQDTTARIWDIKTGLPIAELYGHTRPVYAATFSPTAGAC